MTRTANYVVAYEATESGKEAIALGVALARLTKAELRVCIVIRLSSDPTAKGTWGAGDYDRLVEQQALTWLREALALVPKDVVATSHVMWAESISEGLINAIDEFSSDRIVVGASRGGLLGRFTIGSVANALLHASPVPVALAPHGYTGEEPISRITCAIGTRPGWNSLIDSTAAITEGLSVDLRFVTLVEVDAERTTPDANNRTEAEAHLEQVLDTFGKRADTQVSVSTEVAEGSSVENAIEMLEWRVGEVALVGSSRLAQASKIFLGVTAHRMLHSLPVPLIVVPTNATPPAL